MVIGRAQKVEGCKEVGSGQKGLVPDSKPAVCLLSTLLLLLLSLSMAWP